MRSFVLHAIQRGVERRGVKGDRAARPLIDQPGELVAVAIALLEQRQNQQLGAAALQLARERIDAHMWAHHICDVPPVKRDAIFTTAPAEALQLRSIATASTRVARRAGQYEAAADATISSSAAPTRVGGSSATNLEEHAAHDAGRRRGADKADGRARAGEPQRLADNETSDAHRRGAQRHPNRHLAIPLAHGCRHHGIQANRRQQQRGDGEEAQQKRVEPRSGERPVEHLAERRDAHHLHVWVNGAHLTAGQRGDLIERRRGSQHEHLSRSRGTAGPADRSSAAALPSSRYRVDAATPTTVTPPVARIRAPHLQTFADGILPRPRARGDVFAHDRDLDGPGLDRPAVNARPRTRGISNVRK